MRDSVRAVPGPALALALHKRRGARPLTLTLAGLGPSLSPVPAPKARPLPGWGGAVSRDQQPSRPARAHLPQPGVPGPRAAAAEVVSKAGPGAASAPRPGGSGGSRGDLGRWRVSGGSRGRGTRGAGSARRGGGRCVRSVARSAAEARGPQCARRPPAPAAPPPAWGPARGPRGGASLLAAPRSAEGLAPAPWVALRRRTACGSGPPRRSSSSPRQPCPRLADPGS